MKNICFINCDFSIGGGAERVLNNIALNIKDQNCVHIVSLWNKFGKPFTELPEDIYYYVCRQGQGRKRHLFPKSIYSLLKYIKRNRIDIIVLVGCYPASLVQVFKYFTKCKLVFWDHGALINEWDKKVARDARKKAVINCDKTITLTKRNRDDYQKKFHIKDEKLTYIYNAIDEKIFDFTKDRYDIGSKKIITAGRFSREKGFDMMVDVARMVFDKHPDWTWDVYGDGEEFSVIKEKIKDQNLENNLILKGAVDHIYELYHQYAMYVLPSYREGLPLVLLEAKANRLPIVAFDVITGPREIVEDKQDGFLIPCYDKGLMSQRICELIEDETLRVQFSENSQSNIDLFRIDKIITKWISLIKSL